MRIPCPFCGERSSSEFAYLGDADSVRPAAGIPDEGRAHYEATYLRTNPAGPHQELWYHAFGCRSWLRVTRDTRTHEILQVQYASRRQG
jgi:methylglutamate dehydrogenase subunit B